MSQSFEEEEECVFCFEELSKYDIAVLNCPHKYHLHCIQKWNKTSKNFTKVCPQCNVTGEIINIIKGEQSPPISPKSIIESQNDFTSTNQSSNIEQNTYYDQRFNMREITLIDQNNNVIVPRRTPNRRRLPNEEIESTIICCTIL